MPDTKAKGGAKAEEDVAESPAKALVVCHVGCGEVFFGHPDDVRR